MRGVGEGLPLIHVEIRMRCLERCTQIVGDHDVEQGIDLVLALGLAISLTTRPR